jgi:RNA binding exosome subunit
MKKLISEFTEEEKKALLQSIKPALDKKRKLHQKITKKIASKSQSNEAIID